jgi:tetratricopeptide (TPR) repeat protein
MAVLYTAQGDLSQTTPNDLLQAELLIEKAVTLFQQIGNEVETKRMSQALISVRAKLEEYRLYPIRSQQVPKIYPYPIRLRHARHYQKRVHHINFELYSKGEQRKALSLFNQERYQIDTVWRWVTRQSYSEETDTLLLELAEAVVYIGDTYYDLRHERIPQLEAQRDTARRCRQERVEGNALGNLGIAYARLADYQQAITYYESSIAVFRNLIDIAGVARNSWNLGLVYEQQGDLTRADSYMRMYVGFLYNIGHSNAEQIAKHHRRVRRKLARQKKRPWWQFWRK